MSSCGGCGGSELTIQSFTTTLVHALLGGLAVEVPAATVEVVFEGFLRLLNLADRVGIVDEEASNRAVVSKVRLKRSPRNTRCGVATRKLVTGTVKLTQAP